MGFHCSLGYSQNTAYHLVLESLNEAFQNFLFSRAKLIFNAALANPDRRLRCLDLNRNIIGERGKQQNRSGYRIYRIVRGHSGTDRHFTRRGDDKMPVMFGASMASIFTGLSLEMQNNIRPTLRIRYFPMLPSELSLKLLANAWISMLHLNFDPRKNKGPLFKRPYFSAP